MSYCLHVHEINCSILYHFLQEGLGQEKQLVYQLPVHHQRDRPRHAHPIHYVQHLFYQLNLNPK